MMPFGFKRCWIPGRKKKVVDAGLIDTFEDGDYTASPVWTVAEGYGTYDVSISTSAKKTGTYGVRATLTSVDITSASADFTTPNITTAITFGAWIRPSTLEGFDAYCGVVRSTFSMIAGFAIMGGILKYKEQTDYLNFTTTISGNTWYYLKLVWNKTANLASYYLYDSDMVLLESFLDITPKTTTSSATKVGFRMSNTTADTSLTCDIDDVRYGG